MVNNMSEKSIHISQIPTSENLTRRQRNIVKRMSEGVLFYSKGAPYMSQKEAVGLMSWGSLSRVRMYTALLRRMEGFYYPFMGPRISNGGWEN
jgi:hypothetical protein